MYEDESEAIRVQEIAATEEIKSAFTAFYAGNSRETVPYAKGAGGMAVQPITDAIADAITDGKPLAALVALLQGRGDVQALRDALIDDYTNRNAEDTAQERFAAAPGGVYPFILQGATA